MAFPFLDITSYGREVRKIGQGSFGQVIATDRGYALKVIRDEEDLPNYSALHEIVATLKINSPYTIPLIDVIIAMGTTTLVYPLASYSLKDALVDLKLYDLKIDRIILDIIYGLRDIHNAGVLHLDVKPDNILIHHHVEDNKDVANLWFADFGLAEIYTCALPPIQRKHFTMIYEAPEILLGGTITAKADIWSLGVVIAEIFLSAKEEKWTPLIDEYEEEEVLNKIFMIFGTPTQESWPGVNELSNWDSVKHNEIYKESSQAYFQNLGLSDGVIDLLKFILVLNPDKRPSLEEILASPFFQNSSLTILNSSRPTCHEILQVSSDYSSNNWMNLSTRQKIIIELTRVNHVLNLDYVHLAVAVYLLDRLISLKEIPESFLLAYGLAGLQISSLTYEEGMAAKYIQPGDPYLTYIPLITGLRDEIRGIYSFDEFIAICHDILITTSFDLSPVTPYHFLSLGLKEDVIPSEIALSVWVCSMATEFYFNPPAFVAETILNLVRVDDEMSDNARLLAQEILIQYNDPKVHDLIQPLLR